MRQSFDDAWAIGGCTGSHAIEKARLMLAECILAVTNHGILDVNKIVGMALAMFQLEERRQRHR
jgi:hypothetical protein